MFHLIEMENKKNKFIHDIFTLKMFSLHKSLKLIEDKQEFKIKIFLLSNS
jgi:hypothetical protein